MEIHFQERKEHLDLDLVVDARLGEVLQKGISGGELEVEKCEDCENSPSHYFKNVSILISENSNFLKKGVEGAKLAAASSSLN